MYDVLERIHFIFDALQPLVTIAAILAGLWWFILRRAAVRKVNIEHTVQFVPLSKDTYVGVTVTVENIGNRRIRNISPSDEKSGVVIEEVSPWLELHRTSQADSTEFDLDFLGGRYFPEIMELEPGEAQSILFEFIILGTTKVIKVYSFIDNPHRKALGWNRTTIHEVIT